jgi:hypothetical protein
MSGEENRALVGRLADEALTQHNLGVLDDIFHADYVEKEPPPGMGPGLAGLREWLAMWIEPFPMCDGVLRSRSQTKRRCGVARLGRVRTEDLSWVFRQLIMR